MPTTATFTLDLATGWLCMEYLGASALARCLHRPVNHRRLAQAMGVCHWRDSAAICPRRLPAGQGSAHFRGDPALVVPLRQRTGLHPQDTGLDGVEPAVVPLDVVKVLP